MYKYTDQEILLALETLGQEFPRLNWDFRPGPASGSGELVSYWPGESSEEVMVNVFKGNFIQEPFHRQDFFFIHFAYQESYETLSAKHHSRICVPEGSCYIGQPYSGYAARRASDMECIIIGILIRRDTFIREYLQSLSADTAMLRFFLEPHKNRYSEEFLYFTIPDDSPVWKLLGLIVWEYANKTEHTQKIIKPMVMALSMYISSEYKQQRLAVQEVLEDRIVQYIEANSDTVTLASAAAHFGYHPVYLSKLLPKKTGRTFSEILLASRMRRAKLLLNQTDLPIEKIADMLGYGNSSNFYKAFRCYFGMSPRAYGKSGKKSIGSPRLEDESLTE